MNRALSWSCLVLITGLAAFGINPVNKQENVTASFYKETCCNNPNSKKALIFADDGETIVFFFCLNNKPKLCTPTSCEEFFLLNPKASSGSYNITLSNGTIISKVCDKMEAQKFSCDEEGGWTRVANLNMTEPGATCPEGLREMTYSNLDHQLCSKIGDKGGCSSVYYTTPVNYTKVCGKVRGYQVGSPDGIGHYLEASVYTNVNLDDVYVDGISITYGLNTRKHIWTYMGAQENLFNKKYTCPCRRNFPLSLFPPPFFLGSDYFCESANPIDGPSKILYSNDPLWDGKECLGMEDTCCESTSIPWFMKTLNEETNEPIEVRLCRNENIKNEDVPVDIIEILVK